MGEHSDVTWKRLKAAPPAASASMCGVPMSDPNAPEVAESRVVEHDGHDVGSTGGRLGVVGHAGHRLGGRESDLLGFFHGPEGRRSGQLDVWAGVTWLAMQGHVPGPPQPHFPEGLAPFIGYVATREPQPLDDRPPSEPGWADVDGTVLDVFDDVGDWEPMRPPFFKVIALSCHCLSSPPAWARCSNCC